LPLKNIQLSENFKIEYRFWISCNNEALFGKGKIKLLQKIKETGSLRQAAEELKLSYRKAYYSVAQMNKIAKEPLVIMKRGGKSGGKSEVTPYAEKLIKIFLELEQEINTYISNKSF
jgi:molybdate transport system regulatory protein